MSAPVPVTIRLTPSPACEPGETHEPAVWIGCLACYNDGRLVGEWFPSLGADEVTLADVHRAAGGPRAGCEELWVFDHEHLPVSGELDPVTAAAWGELYDDLGDALWPGLCAWVETGSYVTGGDGMPSYAHFEDAYAGIWQSFDEYADDLAEQLDLMDGWPEEARRYFDRARWVRDVRQDHTVVAFAGGVHVFRDL